MNKRYSFITAFVLVSIVLLLAVPVAGQIALLFPRTDRAPSETGYSLAAIAAGIAAETIRAGISCYLYVNTKGCGSSLKHAVLHNLLYSALIASLYIILGGFYFQVSNPLRFAVTDSFILLVQGIGSGWVMFLVFKNNGRHKDSAPAKPLQEQLRLK